MDVRTIDVSATTGRSRLHLAAPAAKLAASALVLAAVVLQHNVLVVLGIALAVVALAAGSRLPMRLVLGLAAYPAMFAAVFAFAAAPDPLTGSLFVAKAVSAALTAVVLVASTPYPYVFAPIQGLLPEVVGDALLMTYRALFLLAEKFDRLRTAVRLRSGLAGTRPLRSVRATASALGSLVLYAFDLSQREYDVMRLRGYEGRLKVTPPRSRYPVSDSALVLAAAGVLGTAVVFRITGAALTPYSWLVPAFSLLVLLAAVVWRLIRR